MKAGDRAPDFTLPDQGGKPFRLKDRLGRAGTVIFFYPKDNTPVCTAQACSFRDKYETFIEMGVTVVGISTDTVDSHKVFASQNKLTFPILSDKKGDVHKLYRVKKLMGLMPGRVTYVLDPFGIVAGIYSDLYHGTPHVAQAIRMLMAIDGD